MKLNIQLLIKSLFFKHAWMPEVIFCSESTWWDENKYQTPIASFRNCVLIRNRLFLWTILQVSSIFNSFCVCIFAQLQNNIWLQQFFSVYLIPIHQYSIMYHKILTAFLLFIFQFFFPPGLVECSQRQAVPTHWSDSHIGSFRRSRARIIWIRVC